MSLFPSCLQSFSMCLFFVLPVSSLLLYVYLSFLSPVFFYMSVCLLFRLLHLSFLSSSFILPVYSLVNAIYSTLLYNSLTLICTGTTWPYPVRLSPISGLFAGPWFPRLWNSVPSWKRYEYLPTAFFYFWYRNFVDTEKCAKNGPNLGIKTEPFRLEQQQ